MPRDRRRHRHQPDQKAIDEAGRQVKASQQASRQASEDFDRDFSRNRAHSFAQSLQSNWPAAAREIRSCVNKAGGDARAMERCDEAGQRLVHTVRCRNLADDLLFG